MIEIGNGNKIKNCKIDDLPSGKFTINQEEIIKNCQPRASNITAINRNIFIDGRKYYKYKNGKWKKTFRALFHKYF